MSHAPTENVLVRLLKASRHGYLVRTGLNPYYWSDADAPFARLFGVDEEPVGVGAGLAPQELHFLEMLVGSGFKAANALVIGNAFGWSSVALGMLLPDATVVAMEAGLEGHDTDAGAALTHAIAAEEGLHVRVVAAWSPRDTASVVKRELDGAPIDLVLVDGLHVNEQLVRDAAGVLPLLSAGGIVLLHDVLSWHMLGAFDSLAVAPSHERRVLTRTPSGLGLVFPCAIDAGVRDVIDAFCDETVNLASMLDGQGATAERPGPLFESRLAAGWKDRRVGMAATYAAEGRADLERDQLEQMGAERPDDADVQYRVGVWLADHGDWRAAEERLRAAIALRPTWSYPVHQLGRALRERGERAAAEPWLKRASELDPAWAAPHFELGLLARTDVGPQAALAHFARAVDLEPNWTQARIELGRAAHDVGDAYFAKEALRPLDHAELPAAILHILALASEQVDGPPTAAPLFERAGALAPESADVQFDVGRMRASSGDLDGALIQFLRAGELRSEWADAWMWASRLARELGRVVDEERALSALVLQRGDDADEWYALAQVRARIGKGSAACDACARAVALILAPDAVKTVARLLLENGDAASAEGVLNDALDRRPDWAGAHFERGCVLERLGRAGDAHAAYARASALRPDWREASKAAERTREGGSAFRVAS